VKGDHNAEAALRLCSALWRFWDMRGYITEGQRWLKMCLEAGGNVSPLLRARALSAAGNLALEQDEYDRALALHDAALAMRREAGLYGQAMELATGLGDPLSIAGLLNSLGAVANRRARTERGHERARKLYLESLFKYRELGHRQGIAECFEGLATAEMHSQPE